MMIEGRPVELHNIGIPAFVISVAAETGASAGLPVAARKTHVGADLISDLIGYICNRPVTGIAFDH